MKVKEVWVLEPLEGAPPQNGLTVWPAEDGPPPCKDCPLMIGGVANAACHESRWVDSDIKSDLGEGAKVETIREIDGRPVCRHPYRWILMVETPVEITRSKA